MRPFAPPLPIDEVLPELVARLEQRPFVVLVAAPGAGKTTRVPLALLDSDWRGDRKIIVLEPRRLAARAAARRMAASLGEAVGETVGYRVRLDAKVTSRTRIEVVTEGVFTRMLIDDPELSGVAAVLFDEFHERSLDGDLGLALALDATELREDLRILVMSATIDGARVASLLDDAPVVQSEGRAFPIDTRHVDRDPLMRLEDQVALVVRDALRQERGSILVFLPGQGEISRTQERLVGRVPPEVDVVPLYGQLSASEQDRAIEPAPSGRRKVVLSTSIAETSLTIEGVRIVIDCGMARVPVYEPATGLSALQTRAVSRASADQRRGRAGRTEPGVCYRLWSEEQTSALSPFETPEILAADLSGLALDLANWGVGNPRSLRFLDPPPLPAWTEAISLLRALGALDAEGRITPEGRALARLPLHPRLAHMIHRAALEDDAGTASSIAVLLTERGLGGDGIDLSHRLSRFRSEPGRRADEARKLASRWERLSGGGQISNAADVGRHLARAYPDRVAQAAGARGRFRLANGRAASVDETDALARADFLVVADLTGSAGNSRIRAAATIDRTTIEELLSDQIRNTETLQFDRTARAVRARKVTRLGALVLDDVPTKVSDLVAAAELFGAGMVDRVGELPWSKEQRALRSRCFFLHQTLGGAWPDLSDAGLGRSDWIEAMGRFMLADVTSNDLEVALAALLPWPKRQEIDSLLPSHFDAPSGSRLPIDYAAENGPALEVRVQELFGLKRHPAVGGGNIPLLLVLLSPAHRPIQTTRDLPGFWSGSWKDVAKDLRGRYPRHFWPDDPAHAQATSRAKPRGT